MSRIHRKSVIIITKNLGKIWTVVELLIYICHCFLSKTLSREGLERGLRLFIQSRKISSYLLPSQAIFNQREIANIPILRIRKPGLNWSLFSQRGGSVCWWWILFLYSTTIVTIECPWQGIIREWDSDMSTSERCVRRFTRDFITSITLKTSILLRETSSHTTSHLRRSKRVVNVFTAQMGLWTK